MLPPRLQEILDDLAFFTDRSDRIEALISLSEQFRPIPPELSAQPHDETKRVPGCESEAFAWAFRQPDGTYQLEFDVLSRQGLSAMALSYALKTGLDGERAEAILNVPETLIPDLFGASLSMGKTMGLTNTLRLIQTQVRHSESAASV